MVKNKNVIKETNKNIRMLKKSNHTLSDTMANEKKNVLNLYTHTYVRAYLVFCLRMEEKHFLTLDYS